MNSIISAILLLQFFTFSVINRITVGDSFTAAVEYGTLLEDITDTPDAVTLVHTRNTYLVAAHYGLAGTKFHSFKRGEAVSLFDTEGIEHHYTLTHSWSISGGQINPRRLWAYPIVFVTCTDADGTGTLFWAGQRTK